MRPTLSLQYLCCPQFCPLIFLENGPATLRAFYIESWEISIRASRRFFEQFFNRITWQFCPEPKGGCNMWFKAFESAYWQLCLGLHECWIHKSFVLTPTISRIFAELTGVRCPNSLVTSLFVTSKNELSNSPIKNLKCCKMSLNLKRRLKMFFKVINKN